MKEYYQSSGSWEENYKISKVSNRGYGKFQEESDNDVGSDNDNYFVIKINNDRLGNVLS